jgi:hypothetical protein
MFDSVRLVGLVRLREINGGHGKGASRDEAPFLGENHEAELQWWCFETSLQ